MNEIPGTDFLPIRLGQFGDLRPPSRSGVFGDLRPPSPGSAVLAQGDDPPDPPDPPGPRALRAFDLSRRVAARRPHRNLGRRGGLGGVRVVGRCGFGLSWTATATVMVAVAGTRWSRGGELCPPLLGGRRPPRC